MKSTEFSTPLPLSNVKITDSFWHRQQELVRKEVIPYQWDALNDRVEGAAPSFCMRNFKVAGRLMREKREKRDFVPPVYSFRGFNALPDPDKGMEEDKFYGFVFQDSDFAKWIEAVGYSLTVHPDPELERIADEAIDIVCAAQAENGYLDTYYIINGMDRIFTNLKDHHELYCLGHLVEGAIAYFQATGKDKLLKAAMAYGDFVCECFGPGAGQKKGYPGHEIAEMALVKLFEITGDMKYLELSSFFIDQRGTRPYYFETEERERAEHEGWEYKRKPDEFGVQDVYHQAHKPVREQEEAVGHAVRAVYLYSGMADVARVKGDEGLYEACSRLWNSIVRNKLYITGGIGGTHVGEAFAAAYDLPNDTAYSETCAAIGLVFFARRMLQIEAKASYGDVMELALYNTVPAGMALDGKSFFYVNPLEVFPDACKKDERKFHVKSIRQKWFGCACCPPNIARMVTSLGAYAYTDNMTTLFTHLYVAGSVRFFADLHREGRMTRDIIKIPVDMEVRSEVPRSGHVETVLRMEQPVYHSMAFRIPGWTERKDVEIRVKRKGGSIEENILLKNAGAHRFEEQSRCGFADTQAEIKDGYLYLTGIWQDGDSIELEFPMPVRAVESHEKVRENLGKAALMRGPICYCIEEADNGKDLHLLSVSSDILKQINKQTRLMPYNDLGHELTLLKVPGIRKTDFLLQEENPDDKQEDEPLYHLFGRSRREDCELTFIPYYAWNNRGEGEMLVWFSYL